MEHGERRDPGATLTPCSEELVQRGALAWAGQHTPLGPPRAECDVGRASEWPKLPHPWADSGFQRTQGGLGQSRGSKDKPGPSRNMAQPVLAHDLPKEVTGSIQPPLPSSPPG